MNPAALTPVLDGQLKICWNGVEFPACYWRGGTRSPDLDEREFDTNCGTIGTLNKIKKITFSVEFANFNTADWALLAPHLANGTGAQKNVTTTSIGCSANDTQGPLYIEFECAGAESNSLFYPNARINFMQEDIDFSVDDGLVISVSWDAFPGDSTGAYPGVIEIIGNPNPDAPETFDCATGLWA